MRFRGESASTVADPDFPARLARKAGIDERAHSHGLHHTHAFELSLAESLFAESGNHPADDDVLVLCL